MDKKRKNHLIAMIIAALATGVVTGSALAGTVETDLPPPDDFLGPINNAYWPLLMGDSFAYRAEAEDGCEFNKLTVTDETYSVEIGDDIYVTRIVRDQEWEADDCDLDAAVLVEDTKDYYAQDGNGNVWYFGEETYALPDEDEGEECDPGGSWEAGQPPADDLEADSAEPGIVMLGSPQSGDRYRQEFLEGEAEDWGAVLRLNAKVDIDNGEFVNCLMTREWTPIEPGGIEHKFYCPFEGTNVGPAGLMFIEELKGKNVYVEFVGGEFDFDDLPGEFHYRDGPEPFPSAALDCELSD